MIYLRHLKFNTIQITTPGSEKNVQLQIVISEKLYTTGELPKDLSENVLILKRKKNRLQELQISKSDTRAIKINQMISECSENNIFVNTFKILFSSL